MKKILYIFTGLLCLLLTYIVSFSFSVKDTISWDDYGKNSNGLPMYLQQLEINNLAAFKQDMVEIANRNQVSVLMMGNDSVQGQEILWKGIFASETNQWQVALNNGDRIQFCQQKAPFTFQTGTKADEIRDVFHDNHVIFLDLLSAIERYGAKHEYFIEGERAPSFLQEMAQSLGTDSSTLSTQTSFHTRGRLSTLSYLAIFSMLILSLLYVLVLLAYLSNAQRHITILCLHGYSQFSVEATFFRGVLWIFLLSAAILCAGISIYASSWTLFLTLCLVFAALLFILFCIYAVAFRASIHQSFANLLKGKKPSRIIYLLSQGALCLLCILFVYTIFIEGSSIDEFLYVRQQRENWEPYQNLGVLTGSQIGDNLSSLTGGHNDALLEQRSLFDLLWKQGAVYFSSSMRKADSNPTRVYPFIIVNRSYLLRYPLQVENGDGSHTGDFHLYIPADSYNDVQRKEIEDIAKQFSVDEAHSEDVYPYLNAEEKRIPTVPESIPVHRYNPVPIWQLDRSSDPQELAQSGSFRITASGWIEDAVVLEIPLSALSSPCKDSIAVTGTRSSIKLPEEWYQNGREEEALGEALKNAGLLDNGYQFRRLGDYQCILDEGKETWIWINLVLLISILLLCVLSSVIVQNMRLALQHKKLTLEHLHGYRFIDSHGGALLPAILVMLLAYPLFHLAIPEVNNRYVFILLLMMVLIFTGIWMFSTYAMFKNTLSKRLKGAEP